MICLAFTFVVLKPLPKPIHVHAWSSVTNHVYSTLHVLATHLQKEAVDSCRRKETQSKTDFNCAYLHFNMH